MNLALFQGGAWLGITFISGLCFRFLNLTILSHILSLELFGKTQFFFSAMTLLAIFSLPEMEITVARSAALGRFSILIEAVKEKMKWALLGTIVLFGYFFYFWLQGDPLFTAAFLIACIFFPLYFGFSCISAYFYGQENFRQGAIIRFCIELIRNASFLILIYLTGSIPFSIFGMMLGVSLFQWWIYRKAVAEISMPMEKEDHDNVGYGRHLTFSSFPKYLFPHADKLIVGLLLNYEALAIYACAIAPIIYFHEACKRLIYLHLPKLTRLHDAEVVSLKKEFFFLSLGLTALVLLAIFSMPWVIPFFFTVKYLSAVPFAQWFLASLFFSLPSMFLTTYFQVQKRTKVLYWHQYSVSFLFIGLATILLPSFGIFGVVFGKIIAELCGFSFLMVMLKNSVRIAKMSHLGASSNLTKF